MESLEPAVQYLVDQNLRELAALLAFSRLEVTPQEKLSPVPAEFALHSPEPFNECLRVVFRRWESDLIDAINKTCFDSGCAVAPPGSITYQASYVRYPEEYRLLPELILMRHSLQEATYSLLMLEKHGRNYYQRFGWVDAALKERGWDNPIAFKTLLDWDDYASKNLRTAPFREQYLNAIFQPLVDRLLSTPTPTLSHLRQPTGWDRVDRGLRALHIRLAAAQHEEDFQTIGLTCREVLISVGQAVYVKDVHGDVDGVWPGVGDGARMIEAFISAVARGDANSKLRKHAKASMELAVELQHKRTADFAAAALCLEATVSVANIVSILAGRKQGL